MSSRIAASMCSRGGSWRDQPEDLEVTTRNFYDNDVRYPANGLRVARDLD